MRKPITKKTFFALVVAVVFILSTLATCAPISSPTEPASSVVATPDEIQRVELEESKAAFDSGKAVFVDVRTASAYGTSHIPGALSIPLAELQSRINELDPNQWIITYCT